MFTNLEINSRIIAALLIGLSIGAGAGIGTTYFFLSDGGNSLDMQEENNINYDTFPSSVGSSVTYGIYDGENQVGYRIFEVTEKQDFKGEEMFKVKVKSNGEYAKAYWLIDDNGRCLYHRYLNSPNIEITSDYENMEFYAHVIGTDIENTVEIPSDAEAVVTSWRELLFSGAWWRNRNLSLGKETTMMFVRASRESEDQIKIDWGNNSLKVEENDFHKVPAGNFPAYGVLGNGGVTKIWISKNRDLLLEYEQVSKKYVYKLDNFSGF